MYGFSCAGNAKQRADKVEGNGVNLCWVRSSPELEHFSRIGYGEYSDNRSLIKGNMFRNVFRNDILPIK